MPSSVSASVSVFTADTTSTNQRLATPKPTQATPTTAQPIRVQNDTHDTPAAHDSKGTLQTTAQKPPKQKRGFFSKLFSKRTTSVSVQGGKLVTLLQLESAFSYSQTKIFCVCS